MSTYFANLKKLYYFLFQFKLVKLLNFFNEIIYQHISESEHSLSYYDSPFIQTIDIKALSLA